MRKNNWLIPFGIMFLAFIIFMSLKGDRDGDLFFMVANGEYILKHGFPHENPFVMHDGLKIVIQQWIPSVAAYLGYKAVGWEFFRAEAVAGLLILAFVIYKLISLNEEKPRSFFAASVLVSMMLYLIFGKPMLYSMILLVLQMYICEKKASWLWLPVIVLLEANIHASFIAFHFVYLLPYIVPGLTKMLNNTADYKYIKAFPLMVVGALINPYGLDGALYLFNSFTDNLMGIGIHELAPISIKSFEGVVTAGLLLFIAVRLYVCHIKPKKPIDSHRFYTFAGSVLLLILFPQLRNHIFVIIGSIPLLSTLLLHPKGKTPPQSLMWVVAVCSLVACFVCAPPMGFKNCVAKNCADYLEGKKYVLYNTFNAGPYLEMRGDKVFIDSRPELFFKSINGKEDIIKDFSVMQHGKDCKKVIDKYGFTHYCVSKGGATEKYLKAHGYREVARDKEFVLYEN